MDLTVLQLVFLDFVLYIYWGKKSKTIPVSYLNMEYINILYHPFFSKELLYWEIYSWSTVWNLAACWKRENIDTQRHKCLFLRQPRELYACMGVCSHSKWRGKDSIDSNWPCRKCCYVANYIFLGGLCACVFILVSLWKKCFSN